MVWDLLTTENILVLSPLIVICFGVVSSIFYFVFYILSGHKEVYSEAEVDSDEEVLEDSDESEDSDEVTAEKVDSDEEKKLDESITKESLLEQIKGLNSVIDSLPKQFGEKLGINFSELPKDVEKEMKKMLDQKLPKDLLDETVNINRCKDFLGRMNSAFETMGVGKDLIKMDEKAAEKVLGNLRNLLNWKPVENKPVESETIKSFPIENEAVKEEEDESLKDEEFISNLRKRKVTNLEESFVKLDQ